MDEPNRRGIGAESRWRALVKVRCQPLCGLTVSIKMVLGSRMHELSIVYGVVTSATEALAGRKVARVNSVLLRVGALSGIMEDPLQFGWSIATADTVLAGSALIVEHVPVTVRCRPCGQDVVLEGVQSFRCPLCGELSPEIVAGRELEIVSLEIEEDGDDAHSGAAAGDSEKERPTGG